MLCRRKVTFCPPSTIIAAFVQEKILEGVGYVEGVSFSLFLLLFSLSLTPFSLMPLTFFLPPPSFCFPPPNYIKVFTLLTQKTLNHFVSYRNLVLPFISVYSAVISCTLYSCMHPVTVGDIIPYWIMFSRTKLNVNLQTIFTSLGSQRSFWKALIMFQTSIHSTGEEPNKH